MTLLISQDVLPQRLLQLPDDCYSELDSPFSLAQPTLEACSVATAGLLDLDSFQNPSFLEFVSGNYRYAPRLLAQAYAGHQFGTFNPFLGDGRAAYLGTLETSEGAVDLSLKGIGRTEFSRDLDGRAGLKECLAEFEMSERLFLLGVPTVRCLSVCSGQQQVYRSGFQPCAILLRVAESFIRFGSFERLKFLDNTSGIAALADYLIEYYFTGCKNSSQPYAKLLEAIVHKTAIMIAHWQYHGFTHGMMNTDNMSVLGLTLDVGSSQFNPDKQDDFIAAAVDEKGRYAFGNQPVMGLWNLNVLARCLEALLDKQAIVAALQSYEPTYLQVLASLEKC